MISNHPIVVGIAIIATVIFVPNLFLKTPATPVPKAAPRAIIATTHANWLLETVTPSSECKSRGAAGLDHPSAIPKINAPPYAVKKVDKTTDALVNYITPATATKTWGKTL